MNHKYNEELKSITDKKSAEWVKNIKEIVPLFRSAPENMTDASAMALSYRSMIIDEIHYFVSLMSEHSRDMRVLKRDKFTYYSTGTLPDGSRPIGKAAMHPLLGKKLSKSEYDTVIGGDLTEQEYTLQLLSDIVTEFKEHIKTIDSMLYAVKHRLDLFNYLTHK